MNTNRNKNRGLEESIKRAEKGEFREYWLQLYVKANYKKLEFDDLEGPFEHGYDFKGIYKGKRVIIEVERSSRNFVGHGHNPKEVDILIILNDDDTDRSLLPKKIIKIDSKDFVLATHERRRDYAIEKQKDIEVFFKMLPFNLIKKALATLWHLLIEEIPSEDTPESDIFEEALKSTTFQYIKFYDINLEDLREQGGGRRVTRLECLVNDLMKSNRKIDYLTSEENEFIRLWIEALRKEYSSRI
ncbi:MAG: hypothetical protein NOU37_05200 [Candidatus Brocadiales bacterium]|nr:hypothetical protein [Candidatus Bathyanammoxibius amoris]